MEPKAKLKNNKKTKDQLAAEINTLQDRIKSLENDIADQQSAEYEDAIILSTKNISAIIKMNADGIIIVDNDGTVVYVNPAAEKLFGRNKEDFINYPFGFPVSAKNENDNLVIINGDIVREVELRVVQVQWKGQDAYQLSVRDITERKRIEAALSESEENFKSIMEYSADAIFIADTNGRYTYTNKEVTKILGFTAEEMRSKTILDLAPENRVSEYLDIFARSLKDGRIFIEIELLKNDGSYITTDLNMVVLPDGNVYSSCRDITDRKLMEGKIQFQAHLLSMVGQSVIAADPEGIINYWNQAAVELYGWTQEEAIGRDSADIIPIQSSWLQNEEIVAVLKAGKTCSDEFLAHKKDGTTLFVNVTDSPVFDNEGNLISIIGVSYDITERKHAEEKLISSEKRYRRLFEAAKDGILILDYTTGDIVDANPFIVDLMGYPLEAVIGKKLWEIGVISNKTNSQLSVEELKKKDYIRYEDIPLQTSDGRTIQVEFISNVYTVKEENVIQCNIRDITERKKVDGELANYRKHLQDLVQQRTAELEKSFHDLQNEIKVREIAEKDLIKAKEEAVNANRAKSAFLSNMSHEIRTPLNAILGFSQLMIHDKEFPQKQKDRLIIINRSGEHLLNLINDILDFSKIEAGYMTINHTTFNLIIMLRDIESMIKVRAEDKELQLTFDLSDNLPVYIITDERKLRQVLINILGNAIKFTSKGGVAVHMRRCPDDGNTTGLIIDIEDTGPGLSADDLKNLFKAFTQTQTGIRAGGTGLGLAISMEYTKLMGGDITVKSEVGKGSCFTVSLNVQEVKDLPLFNEENNHRIIGLKSGQIFRVLVADDNDDNRLLISDILKPLGFQIKNAVNGVEAIELFEAWAPHVIIMDMRMPLVSGYDAIIKIRNLKGGETVPIIAVTASAFEEDRDKVINWGADGYLRKPFKDYELYNCLKTILDIEYAYEEKNIIEDSSGPDETLILSPELLNDLPDDMIDEILQATVSLDNELLLDLLDRVKEKSPALTESLIKLVKSYQYDALNGLLEKRKGM